MAYLFGFIVCLIFALAITSVAKFEFRKPRSKPYTPLEVIGGWPPYQKGKRFPAEKRGSATGASEVLLYYDTQPMRNSSTPIQTANNVIDFASPTAFITFFIVVVEQSDEAKGRLVIESGGLGLNHVKMVVEANNTFYFEYKAFIYGIQCKKVRKPGFPNSIIREEPDE